MSLRTLRAEGNPLPGRPQRQKPKNFDFWMGRYVAGEIGKKEFLKKVKMCKQDLSKSGRLPFYRMYLSDHGIVEFENNVDRIEYIERRFKKKSDLPRVKVVYEV